MTKRIVLLLPLLMIACAKQQPDQAPGTAAVANIKTGLTVAGVAISATRIALPAFKLDAQDQAAADRVLSDLLTARDSLQTRLAPYDSFDSSNKDQIRAAAQDAIATLRMLNDSGVTHIKNPKAKEQVSAALSALEVVVNLVMELKT